MTDLDITHLRRWIGRTETRGDVVGAGLVERFRATLGDTVADTGDELPPCIHWCLAPVAVPPDGVGVDGHPARGGFLPPVPLPRRMWAGGLVEFVGPLRADDAVERVSRIADVSEKSGRSGRLVFVTVEHELRTGRGVAVRERQDIVYRDAPTGPAAPAAAPAGPRAAEHSLAVDATTLLLFRYSALTFNGHRIHYDRDYARTAEGYPGLVVHGPLQATMLANLAVRAAAPGRVLRFSYRGQSPLFDGARFTVNAAREGDGMALWCADAAGAVTMSATAGIG